MNAASSFSAAPAASAPPPSAFSISFSCSRAALKYHRGHECAQGQRQLDRSAGTPVLAQATGNIVGELRAAVPADERRKQLLRGAGRLCAASFGLLDQLLVLTRSPEIPPREGQQLAT